MGVDDSKELMLWTICLIVSLSCIRAGLSAAEKRGFHSSPLLKPAGETLEIVIASVVLVFLVLRPFVAQAYYVPSTSMSPTLRADDRILVSKLSMRFALPSRRDIVVFRAPICSGLSDGRREMDLVKRVVGLPGDTVEVRDGITYVNGAALRERYVRAPADYDMPPYVVPENMLFVMGDNRRCSSDSHAWGAVDRSLLIGRALMIFWPPSRAGILR